MGVLLVMLVTFVGFCLAVNLFWLILLKWPTKDWGKAEDARRKSLGY